MIQMQSIKYTSAVPQRALQAHSTASQKSITAPWYLVAALALSCVARTLIMVRSGWALEERRRVR